MSESPVEVPGHSSGNGAKRSTLEMVAREAGVSPSTVSRVLNGTAKVADATRASVLKAIEMLDFRPDPAARSLAGGRTMSIGVLTQYLDSPFYGQAISGIEETLCDKGYVPLFVSGHWHRAQDQERLALLSERKVDGIIVLTGLLLDETLTELAARVPVVMVGRSIVGPNLCSIAFDNVEGSRLAVRHLLGLGHRRIAYITGQTDHLDAWQRLEGYKKELDDHDIEFDARLVALGDYRESGGLKAVQYLLQTGLNFSAVIAGNDQMAYGARLALSRTGLRVPDDISLMGFDDLPHSAYTVPPLTTVRMPIHTIGSLAAASVLAMLDGENPSPAMPPAELVVRESTRRILA